MGATYLVRLDDACPTMSRERWTVVEKLLDRHGVRPIVAVVPENRDRNLQINPPDESFWHRVRCWRDKGWQIALHGCTHEYTTANPGLVPINRQSEFAGLPLDVQREKLRKGRQIFELQGLPVSIWVAPSHSFDQLTLTALKAETPIRIISDGIALWPFSGDGFTWIPQQLWGPRKLKFGVWTICLHPNTITNDVLRRLDSHIACDRQSYAADLGELEKVYATRRKSICDRLFKSAFFLKLRLTAARRQLWHKA